MNYLIGAKMKYVRMPIEIESPEQMGYSSIKHNLTESSYTDTIFKDLDLNLNELVICYGDHVGHKNLRELIANESKLTKADDVLLTVGAASALFMISTSLLEKDDELIVVRPNYATNIETPKAIGVNIKYVDLNFENGFQIDVSSVKKMITSKTKLISVTTPHNPTGVLLSESVLKELTKIASEHGIYLLVDETYREMNFVSPIPWASDYGTNVISVSSLSKTYGLPGIRIGWVICRDKKMMELLLAAKEQIFICNSVIDEEIAYRFYKNKEKAFVAIKKDMQEKFMITKNWIQNQKNLEWVEPEGGVVCFPRIKDNVDVEKFYKILNEKYSTYVGPGHWFEQDKRYMRIGYGWPSKEELIGGLENISKTFLEL
jgi:aspartate/methionine/tyrosine aminotransferase